MCSPPNPPTDGPVALRARRIRAMTDTVRGSYRGVFSHDSPSSGLQLRPLTDCLFLTGCLALSLCLAQPHVIFLRCSRTRPRPLPTLARDVGVDTPPEASSTQSPKGRERALWPRKSILIKRYILICARLSRHHVHVRKTGEY